jgi:GT2 family glycosyltransferase
MCLGADVLRGENQKPFDGKINYTHLMWIDSDTIFEPQDFQKLLDDDKDIVCGLYPMQNGKNYVVVKDWDEDYFKKNGSFHFLENSEIPTNLFECVYAGMGFMLVKKGVFESIRYPWFQPINTRIKANPDIVEFTSEDVAFCLKAAENGYKIWVDPIIRVGHEKKIVIR